MVAVNKAIIIGNCGKDPEVAYTRSGKSVVSMNIATTERRKDRETNELREHTEWHRVVFWDRLAEIAAQYLHKGSQVYVEGRLQTRRWENQQGFEQSTTEIIANNMQMLGRRGEDVSRAAPLTQNRPQSRPAQAPQEPPAERKSGATDGAVAQPASSAKGSMGDMEDDLPF